MLRAFARLLGFEGKQIKASPNNIIFITGCDSGLGHMLAVYCHSLNMTVVSACHNINSPGARMLEHLNVEAKRMIPIEMDLLKEETVRSACQYIENLLSSHDKYQLMALVNNAGVMCFGEYEWQTWRQIQNQIQVNLLGTMRLTRELLPLLRFQRGRIINITSHCAFQPLPKVAAYSASKGGLKSWNDALRMELEQYDIKVINFVPGGFVTESNIASRQQQLAEEMFANFSEEQKQFYGDYFKRFNNYLQGISNVKAPNQFYDKELLRKFKDALTNPQPRPLYIHESWRYKFYRLMFQYCPGCLTSWLVDKFASLPKYSRDQGQQLATKRL